MRAPKATTLATSGSRRIFVVELRGIEPLTSCLQSTRVAGA